MFTFLVALQIAASSAPDPGIQPRWSEATELGTRSVVARLSDPESARIAWPYRFYAGSVKIAFEPATESGWITCGLINAKNRMGGYTGAKPFVIVLRGGKVMALNMDDNQARMTCSSLKAQGFLQASGASSEPAPVRAAPLSTVQQAASSVADSYARAGGVGLAFLPTNAGLVVLSVAPNSIASVAGFKTGDVLESVNGIDLRGMPELAVMAVLKSLPRTTTFQVAGRGKVILQRPGPL